MELIFTGLPQPDFPMSSQTPGLALIESCGQDLSVPVLKAALRSAKQSADAAGVDSRVNLSEPKANLIEQLRSAHINGHFPFEAIQALVQEHEENGNQHIFYYRPVSAEAKVLLEDGNAIAEKLFGNKDYRQSQGFPRLGHIPVKHPEWIDFRVGQIPKKPKDWIGKIYLRMTYSEPVPEKVFEDWAKRLGEYGLPAGWRFEAHQEVPHRAVIVVRWNAPDLLEVRISRDGLEDADELSRREAYLWTKLTNAISRDSVAEWNLTRVRNGMASADNGSNTILEANRIALRTKAGVLADFRPGTPEEKLGSDVVTRQSIRGQMKKKSVCEGNSIRFLAAGSGEELEENLIVVVGRLGRGERKTHEIMIRSAATSRAVDYVTNQLRAHE